MESNHQRSTDRPTIAEWLASSRAIEKFRNRLAGWRTTAVLSALMSVFVLGRCLLPGTMCADYSPGYDLFRHLVVWGTAANTYLSGDIPYWVPELDAGFPLWGSFQWGLSSPAFFLFLFLPLETAYSVSAFLHNTVAAVGMYLLCRPLRTGHYGAVVGGLSFGLSSFFVGRYACGHLFLVWPLAWFPWSLWGLDNALARPSGRNLVIATLFLAMALTAGHAQMAIFMSMLYGFWILLRLFVPRGPEGLSRGGRFNLGSVRRTLVTSAIVGIAALGLTAWQWVPFVELLVEFGGTKYDEFTLYGTSAPPEALWSYLLPYVYGVNPGVTGTDVPLKDLDYLYNGHEWLCFSSSLVAWLALVGVTAHNRRLTAFLVSISLLGLLLVSGPYTPFYGVFAKCFPLFAQGRSPGRAAVLLLFGVCLLAAQGCRVLEMRIRSGDQLLRSPFLLGAAITLLIAFGSLQFRSIAIKAGVAPDDYGQVLRWSFVSAILPLFAGLTVLCFAAHRRRVRIWRWGVIAITCLATAVIEGRRIEPMTAAGLHAPVPPEFSQEKPYEFRVVNLGCSIHDALFGFQQAADVVTILDSPDYQRLRKEAKGEGLAVANVKYVDDRCHYKQLNPPIQVSVWHRLPYSSLPRAKFYAHAEFLRDESRAIAKLSEGTYPIHQTLMLHEDQQVQSAKPHDDEQSQGGTFSDAQADIMNYEPGHIVVQTASDRDGWLYLAEKHFPGWQAEVDGRAVDIERAFIAFSAIPVSSGKHRVELSYKPPGILIGQVVSAFSLLMCVALAFRKRSSNLQVRDDSTAQPDAKQN